MRGGSAEAYRAAGAMYRADVEELCKDLGAEGNNLASKINDLFNRGVTSEIVEDLHEARFLGNWSCTTAWSSPLRRSPTSPT